MKYFSLVFCSCYVIFATQHQVLSLKCRSGNQQSDDQFQKIMQTCRKRFLGYDRENDRNSNGRETDSQESLDSDEDNQDMFDNKFLISNGNKNNKNDRKDNGNRRYDYSYSSPSSRNMTRQSPNRNWGNRSYLSNSMNSNKSSFNNQMKSQDNRRNMKFSDIDSRGYSDNYSSRYNNYNNNMNYNGNSYSNNDDNYNSYGNREQACVIQCFFNELNLVDQRGFPERSSVIGIMAQNVQDFELRDFIEESVIECYHYLNNNGRQEKCQFSQNLLSCLAEKGSEKCEDWDDD